LSAELFVQIGISLLLGLLVGLQRQRTESTLGGIRTYPLIAAFGTVCGWLALEHGGWVVAAGLLALAALLVVSNFVQVRGGDHDAGQTSEIAALLLFGVGAYLVVGEMALAVALGGVIAVLLHFKDPLHAFAARIGERDVTAIMQFVLITLVVLPVLPDRAYGPYQALNPFEIWLMVVLIVALGLVGYAGYKLLGARQGAVLGGVIGGLVSSTATTVTFARRVAAAPGSAAIGALVIMIASAIGYARVVTEVAIVAGAGAPAMVPPLAAMLAASAAISIGLFVVSRDHRAEMAEQGNPASLRLGLTFAAVYAVVTFVIAAVEAEVGLSALYPVALVAGLTDVDAITLSSSQLVAHGRLDGEVAWRMVLVATLSNLAFKGVMAGILGGKRLLRFLAPAFGLTLLAGIAVLGFWPVAG
jgi:uncharacterized membrane protein (DUF4010 family)